MRIDFAPKFGHAPYSCYHIYIYRKNGKVEYYKGKGIMAYGAFGDSVVTDTLKITGDSVFADLTFYLEGKLVRKQSTLLLRMANKKNPETMYHGHLIAWHPNGQKKEEGEYYYGKKAGEWKYWDRDGKPLKKKE